MGEAVRWIEIASYALIALLGLQLTWTKGRVFFAALRGDAHSDHHHDHDHGHDLGMNRRTDMSVCITTTLIILIPITTIPNTVTITATMVTHMRRMRMPHTTTTAAIHTGRCRRSWQAPAAGVAASKPFSRRPAALFRSDPGSGFLAGAGAVLGRYRRHLHDRLGTALTVAVIALIAVSAKSLAAGWLSSTAAAMAPSSSAGLNLALPCSSLRSAWPCCSVT